MVCCHGSFRCIAYNAYTIERMDRTTYSVAEYARVVGIGTRSAYRRVQRGEIPYIMQRGCVRIPRLVVERQTEHVYYDEEEEGIDA